MPPVDDEQQQSDEPHQHPAVQCDACQSAHHSQGRHSLSFLLLNQLTVPVIGCDEHLEQFRSVCELTTEETAKLLDHRPAGGISCPGCRLAPYEPDKPLLSIEDGAVVVLACQDHQSETVERFQTGLQMRQHLTTDIDAVTDSSL